MSLVITNPPLQYVVYVLLLNRKHFSWLCPTAANIKIIRQVFSKMSSRFDFFHNLAQQLKCMHGVMACGQKPGWSKEYKLYALFFPYSSLYLQHPSPNISIWQPPISHSILCVCISFSLSLHVGLIAISFMFTQYLDHFLTMALGTLYMLFIYICLSIKLIHQTFMKDPMSYHFYNFNVKQRNQSIIDIQPTVTELN